MWSEASVDFTVLLEIEISQTNFLILCLVARQALMQPSEWACKPGQAQANNSLFYSKILTLCGSGIYLPNCQNFPKLRPRYSVDKTSGPAYPRLQTQVTALLYYRPTTTVFHLKNFSGMKMRTFHWEDLPSLPSNQFAVISLDRPGHMLGTTVLAGGEQ